MPLPNDDHAPYNCPPAPKLPRATHEAVPSKSVLTPAVSTLFGRQYHSTPNLMQLTAAAEHSLKIIRHP